MSMPSPPLATDENLFASLPGGQAVIDWFGFCPVFHDGTLERLELSDGNDANSLRSDPLFKLAMDRLAMLPVGPLRHALSYLVAGSLLEGRKASYQIMTFPKPLFLSGWS